MVTPARTARLARGSLIALSFAARTSLHAQTRRPLGIDEALGTLTINGRMPVDLSPDGQWVAYTVYDSRRRQSPGDERYLVFTRTGAFSEAVGCQVWITNTRTGETRRLGDTTATSSNPVWSPDGHWLAFFSDRGGLSHVWLYERASGTLRQLSNAIPRPFFGFAGVRWSGDSKRLVLKTLPEGMTVAQAAELLVSRPRAVAAREPGSTVVVYQAGGTSNDTAKTHAESAGTVVADSGLLARYLADIAVIDVPSGAVHRVARRVHAVGTLISPDGRTVAYTDLAGFIVNTQQSVYRLMVSSVADPKPRALVSALPAEYGITVSWSPHGESLAYTTTGRTEKSGEAYVVPVGGGEPRLVSLGAHPSFGHSYRAPLWDSNGEHLYFVAQRAVWRANVADGKAEQVAGFPGRDVTEIVTFGNNVGRLAPLDNGKAVYVTTRDDATKRIGVARVDLATGETRQLFERDQYFNEGLWTIDVSDDGRTMVWVAQDAQHADDVWVAGEGMANPRRLTNLNPALDRIALGESRVVKWTTARGDTLHGALLLPAGYQSGHRYPLIVKVYAGSMLSNSVNRFGASGPGVENLQLLATRGYAVLLPDVPQVMPGVDSVIAMGIADPDRLGVTGHSYGGYSTLSLIVQTPRFRAAMASAGPADLISMYGGMRADGGAFGVGWSETGQGLMGGSPWEQRQRYLDNSPLLFMDRVRTPLLVIQGGLDRTTMPWQSDAVFVALRRLGKEVVYAKYEGEDHWEGTWGLPNAVDFWKRTIAWFDAHLKSD